MNHLKKLKKSKNVSAKMDVEEFLQSHEVNLNTSYQGGLLLVHSAIMEEDYDLLHILFSLQEEDATSPPDPNIPDKAQRGWTPLIYAIAQLTYNSGSYVRLLLKHGANPETKDKKGKSAIHWAGELGLLEIIEMFQQQGANIAQKSPFGGILHLAIENEQNDLIEHLLKDKNYPLNLTDDSGNTTFQATISNGNRAIFNIFLNIFKPIGTTEIDHKRGLELEKLLNAQNNQGNTGLHEAVLSKEWEIYKELLNLKGLNVNVKNIKGLTAKDLKQAMEIKEAEEDEEMEKEKIIKQIEKYEKATGREVIGVRIKRKSTPIKSNNNRLLFCGVSLLVVLIFLYCLIEFYIKLKY